MTDKQLKQRLNRAYKSGKWSWSSLANRLDVNVSTLYNIRDGKGRQQSRIKNAVGNGLEKLDS